MCRLNIDDGFLARVIINMGWPTVRMLGLLSRLCEFNSRPVHQIFTAAKTDSRHFIGDSEMKTQWAMEMMALEASPWAVRQVEKAKRVKRLEGFAADKARRRQRMLERQQIVKGST